MSFGTQRERVLNALQRAGTDGVTQHDFRLGQTAIDGGPPIARLASRIDELRDEGYRIENAGWRKGLKIYRLGDPGTVPAPRPRLFDDVA